MQSNIADIEKRTDAPAAEQRLREVLRWSEAEGYADPEVLLLTRVNLAAVIERQSRCSEALELYRQALAEARNYFGGADPGMALLLSNLAPAEEQCGRTSQAVSYAREALQIDLRLGGEEAITTDYSRHALACALIEDDRPGEALAALDPILTRIGSEGPSSSIEWLSWVAAKRSEADLVPEPARLRALAKALKEVPEAARNPLQQARLQRWAAWLAEREARLGAR